ncbi:SURF1 family protein [Sphingomonas sp. LHG3406-1]|uniref:SURF1 family protein n=1 Tax=Sphingomonas sp. LHG3406-1 TaxID=2804617 RepID=UPI002632C324|nr:SURF1 family protein [Sphingomonas sp. LHG3406-1]
MRRVPIFATLVVLLACATMAGLGFWQLDRAKEKEVAIARLASNLDAAPIAIDRTVDLDRQLFRPASATCGPSPTRLEGAGRFGFRLLADCRPLDGGQMLMVQLGTTRRLIGAGQWSGGDVTGTLTQAPDNRALPARIADPRPPMPMIVADPPVIPFSERPAPPSIADIPNNHRSYAVQWFAFAAVALVIYVLALRRRRA